jgi:hypothetical protein
VPSLFLRLRELCSLSRQRPEGTGRFSSEQEGSGGNAALSRHRPGDRCFAASESFQFFALISSFRWVSMGLISPEPLSLTMRRAAPLDFQELANASGLTRQSLTLELKGSP